MNGYEGMGFYGANGTYHPAGQFQLDEKRAALAAERAYVPLDNAEDQYEHNSALSSLETEVRFLEWGLGSSRADE